MTKSKVANNQKDSPFDPDVEQPSVPDGVFPTTYLPVMQEPPGSGKSNGKSKTVPPIPSVDPAEYRKASIKRALDNAINGEDEEARKYGLLAFGAFIDLAAESDGNKTWHDIADAFDERGLDAIPTDVLQTFVEKCPVVDRWDPISAFLIAQKGSDVAATQKTTRSGGREPLGLILDQEEVLQGRLDGALYRLIKKTAGAPDEKWETLHQVLVKSGKNFGEGALRRFRDACPLACTAARGWALDRIEEIWARKERELQAETMAVEVDGFEPPDVEMLEGLHRLFGCDDKSRADTSASLEKQPKDKPRNGREIPLVVDVIAKDLDPDGSRKRARKNSELKKQDVDDVPIKKSRRTRKETEEFNIATELAEFEADYTDDGPEIADVEFMGSTGCRFQIRKLSGVLKEETAARRAAALRAFKEEEAHRQA